MLASLSLHIFLSLPSTAYNFQCTKCLMNCEKIQIPLWGIPVFPNAPPKCPHKVRECLRESSAAVNIMYFTSLTHALKSMSIMQLDAL